MVMATPSPQQVGREFVRQYYTVLHEAPEVLHRFYSSGSTFVHGGVDRPGHTEDPVIGQLEIDKKIRSLGFKDCHTKIRQVDAQSTIGSGVVVQVTGELSNNGEPMRRFMQTFVLAPQTPKKFYVHNDIFRYLHISGIWRVAYIIQFGSVRPNKNIRNNFCIVLVMNPTRYENYENF